jgi:hypothetical protein
VAESCPRTIQLRDGRVFADTRRPDIYREEVHR